MNTLTRLKRDAEIAKYLATPIGKSSTGRLLYPSYEQTGQKFGLHQTHIFRIKKQYLGLDTPDGKRVFKEPVLEVPTEESIQVPTATVQTEPTPPTPETPVITEERGAVTD